MGVRECRTGRSKVVYVNILAPFKGINKYRVRKGGEVGLGQNETSLGSLVFCRRSSVLVRT